MRISITLLLALAALFSFPLSGQSVKQKAPQSKQEQTGTLKISVGVIFKSGDVKPLARTDFSLLQKDHKSIEKEAELSLKLPPIETLKEYIGKQSNASEQLKSWIIKNDYHDFGGLGIKLGKILTIDEALSIPEFTEALKSIKNPIITRWDGKPRQNSFLQNIRRRQVMRKPMLLHFRNIRKRSLNIFLHQAEHVDNGRTGTQCPKRNLT